MIVYLNVGGTVYTTTSDTLNNDGGGYLSILVRNQSTERGRVENTLSKDGNIFIDPEWDIIRVHTGLSEERQAAKSIVRRITSGFRDEAMFYQIPELVQLLEDKLVTGTNTIIAAVSASNNNHGAQIYRNIEFVDNIRVQQKWPDDLPLEQRDEGGKGHGLPLSEYNPETSEKTSLYYLNKGYQIIDTITKDEGFTECPHGHGPNVKDTRCTHSRAENIGATYVSYFTKNMMMMCC